MQQTALVKQNQVNLALCPHPFMMRRDTYVVEPGCSITELMALADFNPPSYVDVRVFINDQLIPRENWPHICPRNGDLVAVKVIPHGGGGNKGILRMVLSFAVMAFAAWAGPALAAAMPELAGMGGFLTGATGLVGMMAVNALCPAASASIGDRLGDNTKSANYALSSATNSINRFGVIPQLLGTKKIVPPMGAMPYTEISGDDQYMRLLFNLGYGPLSISQLKIAEKDVGDYEEVTYEVKQGYDEDTDITLYTNDVYERSLSYKLTFADSWVSDTSQTNADEVSFDITFPNGLLRYDDMGEKHSLTVSFEVEISPTGEEDWTLMATPILRAKELKTLRISEKIVLPENGQYDVRIRRTTQDYEDDLYIADTYWTTLRSITWEDPISETGIAKVSMRIKASGQFNNTVDEFNCVATTICKDWDTSTSTWIERATNNPASLFRHVLQGNANKRPLADSYIDLESLQTWHEHCSTNGYAFNEYVDYQSSVLDILNMICASGRAALTYKDGKYGVIEDITGKTPVQHFSPRNSWGFSGDKMFYHPPHALRVQFLNENEGYEEDEVIVYDDGYDEESATEFETLELPGITNPETIWKHGRYHMAVAKNRSEKYTFNADVENLVCTRGDLIRFSHDVIMSSVAVGRIKSVTVNEGGDILTATMDEEMPMEEGESYAIRFRLKTGTTNLQAVDTETSRADDRVITFTTPISENKPEVGDLGLFGLSGSESMELLVKSVQPKNDLTAVITAVDYATAAVHGADSGEVPEHVSNISASTTIPTPDINYVRSNEYAMLRSSDGSLVPRILVGLIPLSSKELANISGIECQVKEVIG